MPIQKGRNIQIQEELERRILHGLSCEWDAAFWELKAADRERFRKPLFSLQDMENKWGHWSSEKREICLSRKLVLDHSWDSIREVLLHEIAHQFSDDELYGKVIELYKKPGYVVLYVIAMIILAFHLWQGFQSAFQTLGLTHKKYTPVIEFIGKVYAIIVPLGFAIIPVYVYFFK